jgi:hypothetical protein
MRKLYSRFKIFLMMFTLGLASVPVFDGLYGKWIEAQINLPQVESETPLKVFIKEKPKPVPCTFEDEDGYCYCSPHGKGIPGGCAKVNELDRLKDIEDEKNGIF